MEKAKQRGDDIDKQTMNEQRLLEAAEEKKHKIITRMIMSAIGRIARAKYIERTTVDGHTEMKRFYFGGSISVGEQICCKCKFFIFVLYFLIWTSVFTDSYVIFIYIYVMRSCVMYCFWFYDRKR